MAHHRFTVGERVEKIIQQESGLLSDQSILTRPVCSRKHLIYQFWPVAGSEDFVNVMEAQLQEISGILVDKIDGRRSIRELCGIAKSSK